MYYFGSGVRAPVFPETIGEPARRLELPRTSEENKIPYPKFPRTRRVFNLNINAIVLVATLRIPVLISCGR